MGVLGVACQNFTHGQRYMGNVRKTQSHRKSSKSINERQTVNDDKSKSKTELSVYCSNRPDSIKETNFCDDDSGWIRIFCGPDRYESVNLEPSRMVHCDFSTTAIDICSELCLPDEFMIWYQIGGSNLQRLNKIDLPLLIQEEFLKKLGYADAFRRSRLEIDPNVKYLIRFFIGPAEVKCCKGISKSGKIDILKGLVFPQWKKRCLAIVGNYLLLYPENSYLVAEKVNLAGAKIIEDFANYKRFILRVVPKMQYAGNNNFYMREKKLCEENFEILNDTYEYDNDGSPKSIFSSNGSVNSNSKGYEKILFLGFVESWERDLWFTWLLEASSETTDPKRLDIGNSGLQTIPEVVLQSFENVEELLAGQNKLQEIGLQVLSQFTQLRILRLPGNQFKTFPSSLLSITELRVLDLTDNLIECLPDEISQLSRLEDLRIDRNAIKELTNSLRFLKFLRSLEVSQNNLKRLPQFMIRMKTVNSLVDMYAPKPPDTKVLNIQKERNIPPLTKVNLRGNQLRGNIILGNYGNLTQLDVSENAIEVLDLSALNNLESLQCCRNKLMELNINGTSLTSLIAGNNELKKLSIIPTPIHLRHLDVSYNNLEELPNWLSSCNQLRSLFANNNSIGTMPESFFCSELNSLNTLQLGYNNLRKLPIIPKRKLPLQELFVQDNKIEELPDNFFFAFENLILLNISSNKLTTLPSFIGSFCQLERLYATKNSLNDRIWDSLILMDNIRHFHGAYNKLTTLPEECIKKWKDLEELVLSGNKLKHLPDCLVNLAHLKVLRLHSNQLQSTPLLARISSLRVLDLAHNQLDKINLITLVPRKLQFLDLSCNFQLQVDPKQLQACRSQRPMSLVDVSGRNRSSLPSSPNTFSDNCDFEPPWRVGFSETSGISSKLYISQLRLPNFCNTEGLFGIFDGGISNAAPNLLLEFIPKILLEERAIKETANEYMKYTLLSAHRELKHSGQKYGVCATLCHISREKVPIEFVSNSMQGRRFVIRVASVGEASAYLIRRSGTVKLTPGNSKRQIGYSANYPIFIPDPEICELALGDQDEYLIMCNKKLWEIMNIDNVTKEIRSEENTILAAKRVQDIAQSYGAEENLSIIIVKFNNLGSDVDNLVRELRQTVRSKPVSIMSNFCKCGCCCDSNNSCCHSAGSNQFVRQFSGRSDRSSPSGQSDQAISETIASRSSKTDGNSTVINRKCNQITHKNIKNGISRAIRAKIEEENEETDSALSEEQFKCWEYMLEQNTHILFDKELNTISKAFTKNKNPEKNSSILSLTNSTSNLSKSSNRVLSASSPQLIYNGNEGSKQSSNSFLSKHFGSARSFQPAPPSIFKSIRNSNSSGRLPPIGGGPNAAYFGSLQRLMPYNLEYNFAVMHERQYEDEDLEQEGRMQQYWGVATTEL